MELRTWTPFIPGDVVSSMVPGAVFEVQLSNPGRQKQEGRVLLDFFGPLRREAGPGPVTRKQLDGKLGGIVVEGDWSSYALGVLGDE